MKAVFNKDFVLSIAKLAKLDIADKEAGNFSTQFNSTLDTISDLKNLDISNSPAAFNVSNLKNVFREDVVDSKRILSQEEVLSGAKRTHNGYFVVKGILDNEIS